MKLLNLSFKWAVVFLLGINQLSAQSTQKRTQQESVQRLEKVMVLSKNLDEGKRLATVGDWEKAETRFEYVYTNSDETPAFAQLKKDATTGIVGVNTVQAKQAEAKKNYAGAIPYWKKALAVDPSNRELRAALANAERLQDPVKVEYPGNKAATAELQSTVDQINKLIQEGDLFFQTGQNDRARARYDQVLLIDPYNSTANKRIEKVLEEQSRAAKKAFNTRREKALTDVEKGYSESKMPPPVKNSALSTDGANISRIDSMMAKLESIRIPDLKFNDVEIADAVAFLVEQSQKLDPTHEGVNIVLKTEPTQAQPATGAAPGAAPTPPPAAPKTLSLNLKDVPLFDVLRVMTSLTGLQFKVEEYAVFILPANESPDILQPRSFQNIPPSFFTMPTAPIAASAPAAGGPEAASAASAAGGVGVSAAVDVKKQLEDKGVKFSANTSAAWLPRTNRLVVRNTLNQLEYIESLLRNEGGKPTPQINIETKFVEFTEDKLKDASFNFYMSADASLPSPTAILNNTPPAPGTSTGVAASTAGLRGVNGITRNSLDSALGRTTNRTPNTISMSGVLDGSGFTYIVSLLNSALGANLMTAPNVVVQNNGTAKIEVVQDFRYPDPNGYDPPQVPAQTTGGGNGGASASSGSVIPSTPTEFVTRGVGVILNIKQARIENGLIDMTLEPEVTDFDGFINYAEPITTMLGVVGGAPFQEAVTVTEGNLLVPVFSNRKVSTVVRVLDGQTIMMGGLISSQVQEVNDKVPVLGDFPVIGRLFQSKSSQNVKKNLIIFVTARSIKPDGRPEFLSGAEQEQLEISSSLNNQEQ